MAFRCEQCSRDFESPASLEQHNHDKHAAPMAPRETVEAKKHGSRMPYIAAAGGIFIVVLIAAVILMSPPQPPATSATSSAPSLELAQQQSVPGAPIHWHPKLKIVINGQEQAIPANLGLSGAHQPIHTHDATGILHYENNRPSLENMRLGYFFEKVWFKAFNQNCIFEFCSGDAGNVKMLINGQPNELFGDYIPQDGDNIEIRFE